MGGIYIYIYIYIYICILGEMEHGSVDWVHLSKDMDPWWAFVNTVMNISIFVKGG
jgi:hypothetical protein